MLIALGAHNGSGQHLVQRLAVHIDDFKAPVFPLNHIGLLGHASEQQHDHAAQGVIAAALLFRDRIQRQMVFELWHRNMAIQ